MIEKWNDNSKIKKPFQRPTQEQIWIKARQKKSKTKKIRNHAGSPSQVNGSPEV